MSVPAPFLATAQRLALGVIPLDALTGMAPARALRVEAEGPGARPLTRPGAPYRRYQDPGAPRPLVSRHDSGRHVLLVHPALGSEVDLRLYDHERWYVPRRLRVPLVDPDLADGLPTGQRTRRPTLFPGAAYPLAGGATGLRGRVLRDGVPMRWARVEARLRDAAPGAPPLARAHGDDRGECLLVLPPAANPFGDLGTPLPLRLRIYGPLPAPSPTPGQAELDPLWDLPLEGLAAPGADDPAARGETLPAGYQASSVQPEVDLPVGRVLSAADLGDFVFATP
jgi:hypothetical protein